MARSLALPFESKQLFLFTPRASDKFEGNVIEEISAMANLSTAVTLVEEDTGLVVAVGGVLPLWKGVGDVWMVGSDLIDQHPKALYRLAASMLREATVGLELRRLQCSVDPMFPEHIRFIERLGFVSEGLMRKFGPCGEDHVRYAKVI